MRTLTTLTSVLVVTPSGIVFYIKLFNGIKGRGTRLYRFLLMFIPVTLRVKRYISFVRKYVKGIRKLYQAY